MKNNKIYLYKYYYKDYLKNKNVICSFVTL